MTITEIFSISTNLFVSISALITVIIAIGGLSTWQKELKGKAEYQTAKSLLKSVYKVRESFKRVRFLAIFQYEYPKELLDSNGNLKSDKNYDGLLYVYNKRCETMFEAFQELKENYLDAEVELGFEFHDVIDDLIECENELINAISQMLEIRKHPDYEAFLNSEDKNRNHQIIFSHGEFDKDNEFTDKINKAVRKVENKTRKYIIRK